MAIPVYDNVDGYLIFLTEKLNKCTRRWELFGAAAAEAYGDAYRSQQVTLQKVKKSIEDQKKTDAAAMTFALSLLTVGVGGYIAGTCVKQTLEGLVSPKLVSKLEEKA